MRLVLRILTTVILTAAATGGELFAQGIGTPPSTGNNPIANGPSAADGAAELRVGTLHLRSGNVETAGLINMLDTAGRWAGRGAGNGPVLAGGGGGAKRLVLQLHGPITPAQRGELAGLGVGLGDYLPAYAYIVKPGVVRWRDVAGLGYVRWVGIYQDAWKVDPAIGQHAFVSQERMALAAQGDLLLEVTLFDGETPEAAAMAAGGIGGVRNVQAQQAAGRTTLTMTASAAAVGMIAQIPAVQYIEEIGENTYRNDTTRWIVQTNVSGSVPLYTAGIRGEGQVVGHMDGSINISHCSFRDTVNPVGALHRKIISLNGTSGYDAHGTHTAGTAVGDNFTDSGNTRGVAYMAKLTHSAIPSGETGSYNSFTNQHNQGARLHTNSWGNDGTTTYDGLCRGIDRFSYDQPDSLVLFAVTNTSTLKNPENAKNLLAVGACADTPSQANFCSGGAGPTSDGRRKPEVFAPGCNTTSATGNGTVCTTTTMTGTSMACPAVAGAGALVRQYYTDGFYPTGAAVGGNAITPTGALIKATLINGSVDMTGIGGYPSNQEGWGRLLVDEAMYLAGQPRGMAVYDVRNNVGLSTGGQTDRTISVTSATEKLKVTLVWTDPAATAGASIAYINDLDLQVIGPGGTYLGNVFSGGVSVTGGVADNKNNVEQVHIVSPPIGSYTIRVKGTAVNSGTQGYALVISGAVTTGAPPPVNDACASASTASGAGSTAFTTVGATTDGPDEPGACTTGGYTHIGNDIWYKFVASCTGTATVSLCGATFNTKMAVYGPCPTGSGQYLACNDDFCGTSSQVSFAVTQSTVYRVRIGGFNGATGTGTMVVSCTPSVATGACCNANGSCTNAVTQSACTGGGGTYQGDNVTCGSVSCPQPCPADTNNDGQVNVTDLLAVINSYGPCPGCPADINNDNVVNVTDLLAVIMAYGPCP